MTRTELIKQAIESAKCRIYKLNFDLNGEITTHHQRKAENQKELMEITVEALEKQIPKKPIWEGEFIGYWKCDCSAILSKPMQYCYECGKKLDWSEEND